jgi:peptide/nickel transport system permease protein
VAGFVLTRVAQAIFTLLAVTTIVFALTRLSGSPVDVFLPLDATEADRQALVERMGLDRPIGVQYLTFLGDLLRGDLGPSLASSRTAADRLLEALPATLELGFAAILVSILIGIPLGVWSAVRRGGATDRAVQLFAAGGQAIPVFVTGIVLILFFGVVLGWLPVSGRGSFAHLVLPAITLGWYTSAGIVRLMRSSMLEVLVKDYILLARAKGLSSASVIWRHAVKNALLPVVTFAVILFVLMLAGSIVVEVVFAWPGVGRLMFDALYERDYPVVQGGILLLSMCYVIGNLLVDILYGWLDPRTRT